MNTLATLAAALVGLLHAGFLVLEMFLWTSPVGLKAFNLTQEFAEASKTLAANQGLYNGFLAAGLFWGLFTHNTPVVIFFLLCVLVAGVYGGVTVKPSIFLIQALPAAVALALTLLARRADGT